MPDMSLRESILWCIDRDGGSGTWTHVIANMLSMKSYFDKPFKLTTAQVRRELKRMERDGIVERKPTQSRLYIAWGRKRNGGDRAQT